MNRIIPVVIVAFTLWIALPAAAAAPVTATLEVPGMDCPACPITVKKSLQRVPGVSAVEVDYPQRLAIVQFDDAVTTIEALTEATRNAGYPSNVKTPASAGTGR